ncbi:MAG TPA: hypothetical protein ENI79_05665, partial [Rhodospirillales bacterium]|nr:hypothetical protein [Rhodospirillales bacterium]
MRPEIAISKDIAAALGCIRCVAVINGGGPALSQAMTEEANRAERRLSETEIPAIPAIAAARRAYKALGKDPARYRPSAEALLRRVKQGKGLYRVNNAVDVNNMVSLKPGVSIGLYDMDVLVPPLTFRAARDGETYQGIGKGDINLTSLPVLFDAQGPFGCPTSDSRRAMITEKTTNLLMVLFAFGGYAELETGM